MATLAQLRSRVSRKIQDPDNTGITASVVDFEINRSIRYYSNYHFWFNERMVTLALSSGSQVVGGLPTDIKSELEVNGLMIIDSQVKITLNKLNPNDFFDRDQDQTGRPYFYTYRNEEYLVLPTPDRSYTLKFRYLKKYNDLTSDTDENDFTQEAEDLIMLHTIKNIYAEDKQDPDSSAYYERLEREQLRSLTERTNNRLGTGTIDASSILETYTLY